MDNTNYHQGKNTHSETETALGQVISFTITNKKTRCFYELKLKGLLLVVLLFTISILKVDAATYYSRQNGNWNANATWSTTGHGGGAAGAFPVAGDIVYIGNNHTVTVTVDAECASILFDTNGGILTVNNGIALNVSASITLFNLANANIAATLAGNGAINVPNINVGNGTLATTNNTTRTHTLNSTISNLAVTGNLNINSYFVNNNRRRNGVFNQTSGTVTINGSIVTNNANANNTSTFSLGDTNPTLILNGTTPFSLSGTGTNIVTLNGTGATVRYNLATGGQAVSAATYTNLLLGNTSGTNTAGGAITVSGAFTTTAGGTFSTASNVTLNGTTICGGTINATAGTVSYAATAANILAGT